MLSAALLYFESHWSMKRTEIQADLKRLERFGGACKDISTSYSPGRPTLITSRSGLCSYREILFAWMVRNSESAMTFFRLPANGVLGPESQMKL